jgi:DNA-binding SARP family transcriptional activator
MKVGGCAGFRFFAFMQDRRRLSGVFGMEELHIRLFGRVRVAHGEQAPEIRFSRGAQTLLAFLLLHPNRYHPREVLAELAWGDRPDDQARAALNTALWRLRSLLEPKGVTRGAYLRTAASGEVGFNWDSNHWLDLAVFEKCANCILAIPPDAMQPGHAGQLEAILPLYDGELLEGFYEDWAVRERERLRDLHLSSLARLMRYHRRCQEPERGLHYAQEILRLDPLREEIHREAMRLFVENGQRALAIRQFESCREILAAELGIPPMPETDTLYRQILADAVPSSIHALPDREVITFAQSLRELQTAQQEFAQAQGRLQRAIDLVQHLAPQEIGRTQ